MKLVYQGPHDAVVVPLPGGGEALVERDGLLDTTDTHGASLREQEGNWYVDGEPPPAPQETAPNGADTDTTAPPDGEEG